MAVIALAAGEARAGRGGERQVAPDGEVVAHVVVDVADGSAASDRERQWPGCRICHLADGDGELPQQLSGRLVRLGPGCRGELAAAHRRCAEAWFSVRGNRLQVHASFHGLACSQLFQPWLSITTASYYEGNFHEQTSKLLT
jgi:hypothetical protein